MEMSTFVEGPLWWISALLFFLGIIYRVTVAFGGLIQKRSGWLPLHKVFVKKPLYVILRYLFHALIIITPIWLGGHIVLWQESRFNWSWTALPGAVADWFTLIVLGFLIFFLLRRLLVGSLRETSTFSDYGLLLLVSLPFLSGYFLAHRNLDGIPFFQENLQTIHVLSAESLILGVLFLFVKPAFNLKKCTGCSACGLQCPTEAMRVRDNKGLREFFHHYVLCSACAKCVLTCPEEAVTLKHKITFSKLFWPFLEEPLREVEMERCHSCGVFIGPLPLLDRIEGRQQIRLEHLCNDCKKTDLALHIYQSFPNRENA